MWDLGEIFPLGFEDGILIFFAVVVNEARDPTLFIAKISQAQAKVRVY